MSEINSKDGETVDVGALLGTISQKGVQPSEKKVITKIESKKVENNVVNLEIEKKLPKISEEPEEEEPLVLTNEVKEDKPNSSNKNNEILSPAVRKIVVENKIDLEKVRGSGKEGRILKR